MKIGKIVVWTLLLASTFTSELQARKPDHLDGKLPPSDVTGWRAACVRPTKQIVNRG